MVGGGAKHCFALKWLADSISDFPFRLYSFSLCKCAHLIHIKRYIKIHKGNVTQTLAFYLFIVLFVVLFLSAIQRRLPLRMANCCHHKILLIQSKETKIKIINQSCMAIFFFLNLLGSYIYKWISLYLPQKELKHCHIN